MNISFTGIENISAYRVKDTNSEIYTKQGYVLAGLLTNDINGNDKDNFYKALKKSGEEYEWCCFPRAPEMLDDTFLICITEENVHNTKVPKINEFYLNNYKLRLNDDKALPIFSFIGKTMLKLKEQIKEKEFIKFIEEAHNILMKEMTKHMRV